MRRVTAIIALLIFLSAAGTSEEILKNVKPGAVTLDLGDRYEVSFRLPDIENAYNVEAYPVGTSDILKLKSYGFSISVGDEELAKMSMYVYSSPMLNPVPKASTEGSVMPEIMGPRIIMPKTIDNAVGFIGYDLQKGATGTNTDNAITGFFSYYPGARKVSDALGDSLECLIEISGETGGFPASSQSLQVFNSIVNSIHLSGPGL